jgi:hypothetical protein
MPIIGNPIYQSAFVVDQFSGNGSTVAFTMSVAPAGVTNVLVAVSGVLQDPSTYGVVGNTITFSAAPPSGTGNISCRYLGVPVTGVTTTAYRTVTEFTATASQTTFTPPSYNVGFINVYLNGVLLGSADYTATNGTTVVLATGASAGNLVTVESFQISSVANAIANAAGSVGSNNIATGAVTSDKIANGVTINFADGSASTPSITNDGDTNTGIFFPAADSIGFAEGGAEVARFDSSGNLGINTSNPTKQISIGSTGSATLGFTWNGDGLTKAGIETNHVTGEVRYGAFTNYFPTFYSNNTERMRINSAGIVTMPFQPAFHVTQSLGPSGFAANSVATWNTVTTNNGGYFKTTAGTGQNQRFIAPVAGLYHFNVLMLSNNSTSLFYAIRQNGSNISGTNIETYSASAFQSATSTATVYLAANDYVDVFVGSNAAYGSAYANFNGFLIG